jgi:hypothetical protein
MKTTANALVRKRNLQKVSKSTAAPKLMRWRPGFNALKHGLRSGHVLLPGDNVAEFRKLRHRLFHLHKPRTIAEALHVETLAVNEWRKARCRVEQRFFKDHLGAAMDGHADTGGYLCSPDLHRLHHRGTDCQNEERHLERSSKQAQAALAELQKQRTQNLTFGLAEVLEDYTVFLEEGEPLVEAEETEQAPGACGERAGEAPPPEEAEITATPSVDGGIPKILKRNTASRAPAFPRHWNRRQRRAAARRQGLG